MAKQAETQQGSWRARATFEVGRTRRQRQKQYRQQINALVGTVALMIVAAFVVVLINWNNAGAIEEVSCSAFPDFCVPLAGGSSAEAALEAPGSRELDAESNGVEGVTRGVGPYNVATIGDPNAPIHFVTFSDYACPHCQDFHANEVARFIEEYALTGQATFGFVLLTGTGGPYSETASQAALCAGEQGAFWEMSEELFRLVRSRGADSAFSLTQINESANQMGLDGKTLLDCVASNKYSRFLTEYRTFANDNGVTGTPTVMVNYAGSSDWQPVSRSYDIMSQLTEAVNNR